MYDKDTKRDISILLRDIEDKYAHADYSQAYKSLYNLCSECKEAGQFFGDADHILSQYNNLSHDIISNNIELSQISVKKQQINIAFLGLLRSMKQYFNIHESNWEREIVLIKEQRSILYESLMRVENELVNCYIQDKIKILENIRSTIKQTLFSSYRLIELFSSLTNI